MCLNLKLEIWLESRLIGRWLSPKNVLFNGKIPLLWLANNDVELLFFQISRLKLQKLLKSCWPSKTESWLWWVICLKDFRRIAVAKAVSGTWPYPRIKVNSTLSWSFHREPCCEKDVTLNVNFALCSNNKDKLRDLYNYLISINQKVVTAINT